LAGELAEAAVFGVAGGLADAAFCALADAELCEMAGAELGADAEAVACAVGARAAISGMIADFSASRLADGLGVIEDVDPLDGPHPVAAAASKISPASTIAHRAAACMMHFPCIFALAASQIRPRSGSKCTAAARACL